MTSHENLAARIRMMHRGQRVLGISLALMFVGLLVVAVSQTLGAADAKRARGELSDDVTALSSSQAEFEARLDEANDRLRDAGEPTVAVPDAPPVAGPRGEVGPVGPGPSAAQVAQAVRAYCADINGCAGRDGADTTPAQVATAVARYCNDRGECAGPPGDSVKGDQGEVGPQGPPPSDAQVQAAVDAYCTAHGECRGAAGTDGKDGAAGEPGRDGRGITALSCDSLTPTRFTVTYTDGTTQTFTCNAGQPEE